MAYPLDHIFSANNSEKLNFVSISLIFREVWGKQFMINDQRGSDQSELRTSWLVRCLSQLKCGDLRRCVILKFTNPGKYVNHVWQCVV